MGKKSGTVLMAKFKYQEIQQDIELAIESGVFNDAIPSVRRYAKEKSVSISTVQKAYEALELAGKIFAKPQKGYFIRQQQSQIKSVYGDIYHQVSTDNMLQQKVLYSLNDERVLPLSSTAPSSVLNNEVLLKKHHRKGFDPSIFKFHFEDEVQGSAKLRQSLSQYLFRQGFVCEPEQLHINAGRKEGLFVALVAAQALGGKVAVESPTSFFFQTVLQKLCKEVIEIPMQDDYESELALLDSAQTQVGFNTYLVNPSFNDPTGRVLSENDKLALIKWATNKGVVLIEYDRSELYFGDIRPKSLAQLASDVPGARVISICDFFDTISSRVCLGYVIGINMNERLLNAKLTTTEEPNLHTQNLIHSLIKSGEYDKLVVKLRHQLYKNYLSTLKILKQHIPDNLHFNVINGGPCLWFYLHDGSSIALWDKLIKLGIAIAPGSMFSFEQNYEEYFRITFALPWNNQLALSIRNLCLVASDFNKQN